MSAMNGSAVRTRLIWPIPLDLIEFAHCSSVVCSKGPGNTSPAAFATASKGPMLVKRAFRLSGLEMSAWKSPDLRPIDTISCPLEVLQLCR